MTSPDSLTPSQLAQRLDELKGIKDNPNSLDRRIEELTKHLENRTSKFNKSVVNPLPPDNVDVDNPFVLSPKSPQQIERELEEWEKSL